MRLFALRMRVAKFHINCWDITKRYIDPIHVVLAWTEEIYFNVVVCDLSITWVPLIVKTLIWYCQWNPQRDILLIHHFLRYMFSSDRRMRFLPPLITQICFAYATTQFGDKVNCLFYTCQFETRVLFLAAHKYRNYREVYQIGDAKYTKM